MRRGIESGFNDYGMVNWERAAEKLLQQGIISETHQEGIDSTRRITCFGDIIRILTFQPYRRGADDPFIPFTRR